jgi:organic hydroperoxide reductase OsmC/OhrA
MGASARFTVTASSLQEMRMSEHSATIDWVNTRSDFLEGKYSREHSWTWDGGLSVPASASPANVPLPYSNPANVDPEEAFVAAIASCHMLTFLYLASKSGYEIEHYHDEAVGIVTADKNAVAWVSKVQLKPEIAFVSDRVASPAEIQQLHAAAHRECFIANSVKTEIVIG